MNHASSPLPGSFTSLGPSLTVPPSHTEPSLPHSPFWRHSKPPSTGGVTNSSAFKGQDGNMDQQSRTGTCRAQAYSESSPHFSVHRAMQENELGIARSGKLEACILCVLSEWVFCFLLLFFNVNKHGVAETIQFPGKTCELPLAIYVPRSRSM